MIYPKISIITPVYNQVDHLEYTIKSLITQDYPNLEYIIIDGGSTDGTIEIIKKYEQYITYWISEPDNGMYEAIQKGFNQSTGEIMAWLNSDDMYHKGALFTIAEIFTTLPEVDWIEGTNTFWDDYKCGGRTVMTTPSRLFSKYEFLMGDYHWIQQESTVWRRSLWEKTSGINTQLKYAGDFALWLSFFRYAKLYRVDALIGGFRKWSKKQLSGDISNYEEECRQLLLKEQVSKEDALIIKRYKKIQKINHILYKTKMLSWLDLSNRYRRKYFNYPKTIYYSFDKGMFLLGT